MKRQAHGVTGGPGLDPGDTHLLGQLKAMGKAPIRTLGQEWRRMGLGHKALFLGMAGMDAADIAKTKGRERSGRIGGALGNYGTWLALNRVPFAGMVAGSMAASSLGDRAGRGLGHLVGQK